MLEKAVPLALMLVLLGVACTRSTSVDGARLVQGDMIFLDLPCGELCDAIEDVTRRQFGVPAPSLSHVGILSFEENGWIVYEAWEGVQRTPLTKFLARTQSSSGESKGWYAARVRKATPAMIGQVITGARRLLGTPYDADFVVDNGKFYCSELIADLFNEANGGRLVFKYIPMFFGNAQDPDDRSWKIWQNYFAVRKQPVPVGKSGVSPLGIYLSEQVEHIR